MQYRQGKLRFIFNLARDIYNFQKNSFFLPLVLDVRVNAYGFS